MKRTPDELEQLAKILDEQPVFQPREGDYAEEEQPGIITIKRADGTPVAFMPVDLWDAIKERKELEEARARGSRIHVSIFQHLPPFTDTERKS